MDLHRKKYRPRPQESTFIYGIHPVQEALRSGKNVDRVLLKRGAGQGAIESIRNLCAERNIPVQEVPIEKLNRVTQKAHQGIIAFLSEIEYQDIEKIIPGIFENGEMPLLLILDRVTDVRNFGAICRTASCAGVHAVIIPSRGAAQINEDAVKSSAGALGVMPVCRANNLKEVMRFLQDSGIRIVAVSEKSKADHFSADFKVPVALLLGSEEDGISPEYLKFCDHGYKIPMYGPIGSLNVSVAAAVVLFEAVRQRMK